MTLCDKGVCYEVMFGCKRCEYLCAYWLYEWCRVRCPVQSRAAMATLWRKQRDCGAHLSRHLHCTPLRWTCLLLSVCWAVVVCMYTAISGTCGCILSSTGRDFLFCFLVMYLRCGLTVLSVECKACFAKDFFTADECIVLKVFLRSVRMHYETVYVLI